MYLNRRFLACCSLAGLTFLRHVANSTISVLCCVVLCCVVLCCVVLCCVVVLCCGVVLCCVRQDTRIST